MNKAWPQCKVKDFCEFKYGKNLPADRRVKGKYPVYGSSSVASYHDEFLVSGSGLIIGRKGTVGKIQLSKENFFPIDTTFYVDKNSTTADIYFLYYFFQLCGFDNMNSDAAVPGLNRNAAINLKVRVPDLTTQKKIGEVLLAYDDLIENNLNIVSSLKESVKLTYIEWFVRQRYPGHENDTKGNVGALPDGWVEKTLRELSSYINRGVTPKYTDDIGGITVINQKCIRDNHVNFFDSKLTSSQHKIATDKFVKKHDILVNSTGTGTLGRVAQFFPNKERVTVDTHVTIVRPNNKISPYVLGRALEVFEPYIESLGKGATNQQELGRDDLGDILKIIVPTPELMEKFDEIAKPTFELIENLRNQNELLKEARNILLPRIMTGVIDIDKVELPETLLARIKL